MDPARVVQSASNAARPSRKWLEFLARWGFIANAVVYLVVGVLAVRWAIGEGGRITDPDGAFMAIRRASGGKAFLLALVPGFFSYALWRVLSALFDGESDGSTAAGIAIRVFGVIKGCAYAALGLDAIRLALGTASGKQNWTDRLLASQFGPLLLFVIGSAILAFAGYEMYRAYRARLSQGLRLHGLATSTRRWIVSVSRFGIAARAVVIGTFGWLAVKSVLSGHPARTPETAQSIRTAGQSEPAFYLAIGAGLVAYGIYLAVLSRYRQVRA